MNTKYFIPGIILCTVCFICSPSRAELRDTNIQSTRSYLDQYGLNTREWQKLWGSDFFSASPFKEVGSGSSESGGAAYLAYTIDGDLNRADRLTLVLRVNSKAAAGAAHEEMLRAAAALAKMAIGGPLPEVISRAISRGENAATKVGNTSISVIRSDWSTGTGYHLKLVFE
jgi:hypothetical protein